MTYNYVHTRNFYNTVLEKRMLKLVHTKSKVFKIAEKECLN